MNQYNNGQFQFMKNENKTSYNSFNKKFFTTSIPSFTRLNFEKVDNSQENKIKINKTLENKSFDSIQQSYSNDVDIISEKYVEADNDIQEYSNDSLKNNYDYNENNNINNYKYYQPKILMSNSSSTQKGFSSNENININKNQKTIPTNEFTKYNQANKINEQKANNSKKLNNNMKISIFNNNFLPKRAFNTIEQKYGEISKINALSDDNIPSKYGNSFNNNLISYLAQRNYNEDDNENENEDSLDEEGIDENNNDVQANKLTRYDIRKKISMTEGQTFFIKKAKNTNNYQFYESKKVKTKEKNIIPKNIINSELKYENDEKEPCDNESESIYIKEDENDEVINNHNFYEIKVPSTNTKKNNENKKKSKLDNYQYKEIKVKGPDNCKPIMKLRIGINGEKFYEKYVPEKRIIKYNYEPEFKFINNEEANNIGFKKIVSHLHRGVRKKYKKINPECLTIQENKVINNVNNFSLYSNSNKNNIKDSHHYKNNKNINECTKENDKNKKDEKKIMEYKNVKKVNNNGNVKMKKE